MWYQNISFFVLFNDYNNIPSSTILFCLCMKLLQANYYGEYVIGFCVNDPIMKQRIKYKTAFKIKFKNPYPIKQSILICFVSLSVFFFFLLSLLLLLLVLCVKWFTFV